MGLSLIRKCLTKEFLVTCRIWCWSRNILHDRWKRVAVWVQRMPLGWWPTGESWSRAVTKSWRLWRFGKLWVPTMSLSQSVTSSSKMLVLVIFFVVTLCNLLRVIRSRNSAELLCKGVYIEPEVFQLNVWDTKSCGDYVLRIDGPHKIIDHATSHTFFALSNGVYSGRRKVVPPSC